MAPAIKHGMKIKKMRIISTHHSRLAAFAAFFLFILFAGISTAYADKRVALVIGNSEYRHVPRLPNPQRDALAMESKLIELGFNVTSASNTSRRNLGKKILEFGRRAHQADVALVFYAGHGIQVNGTNYIVPVDASLRDELSINEEAYKLDDLLAAIATAKTKLIFMDACRDNPFATQMQRRNNSRSVSRGLARIQTNTSGSLIAFATDPNNIALDGNGENSPFTRALLDILPQPNLEIRLAMGRVRTKVANLTHNRQVPWVTESLFGELYLAGISGTSDDSDSIRKLTRQHDFDVDQATSVAEVTQVDAVFKYIVIRPISGGELRPGDQLYTDTPDSQGYTIQRGYSGEYSATGNINEIKVGTKLYGFK